jgi:drug/metabolite transporter (DMT)-like permease
LAFASCLIYAVWVILAARISGERRETVAATSGRSGSATVTVAIIMSATASVYWVAALATGRPVLPGQIPADAWGGLVGVGVVATFIAIQTFYAGALRIGAAHASLISTAEPIWTIALAAILFSIALTPVQLIGGAFILAGVVIAQTGPVADRSPALEQALRVADE